MYELGSEIGGSRTPVRRCPSKHAKQGERVEEEMIHKRAVEVVRTLCD